MLALKAPAKPLSPRDNDEQNAFLRPSEEERVAEVAGGLVVEIDAAAERLKDADDHARVGTGRECPLLRAAQLGRRDHLHGLGDLPRVFHAADATPEIEYVGHGFTLLRRPVPP